MKYPNSKHAQMGWNLVIVVKEQYDPISIQSWKSIWIFSKNNEVIVLIWWKNAIFSSSWKKKELAQKIIEKNKEQYA